jgi:hypothetical protein
MWPLIPISLVALLGAVVLYVAMAYPERLPGHKKAEEEAEKKKQKWHSDQLELDHKRAEAERLRKFLTYDRAESDRNRRQTEATKYLADEMRLRREAQADSSGDSSPQGPT